MKEQYRTVSATTESILDNEVNQLLNEGWKLYGNPYAHDGNVSQALIKVRSTEISPTIAD